ncbi:IQ domain-containing protein K isoform X8 [Ictidomys tridecemlineatus]
MAASRQTSSRSVQRMEPSGSAESSVATRTPVPTLSSPSPELPVSPGQVAELSGKNLWEQICEEYQAELPPFPKGYEVKQEPEITVSPLEETVSHGFNIEHYFPPPPFTRVSHIPCPLKISETIDPKTCSPRKYLETYIFPILLPGMTSLLHQAKKEKCLEMIPWGEKACVWVTYPRPATTASCAHSTRQRLLAPVAPERFSTLPAAPACSGPVQRSTYQVSWAFLFIVCTD